MELPEVILHPFVCRVLARIVAQLLGTLYGDLLRLKKREPEKKTKKQLALLIMQEYVRAV